jgi:hypothetical protein
MELKWVQCEVVGAGCSFYRVETVRRCERSHRYSTSGEWIVLISLVLRRGKDGAARFRERNGVAFGLSRGGDDQRRV